jgi:putative intracellular protease/amidase
MPIQPELAHPYDVLKKKGVEITIASPKGGEAPVDPYSVESTKDEVSSATFFKEQKLLLSETVKIADLLGQTGKFDALFYPGGAGPMFDLATDPQSQALIAEFVAADKPVAAICHAPVVLQGVTLPNGKYLVDGKKVTGLSDVEEEIYDLDAYVPFSLENRLKDHGAIYTKAAEPLTKHVVVDGKLITGQNLMSATGVGEALVMALGL